MKRPFTKEAYNFMLWGALFGLGFPIVAMIIEATRIYGSLSLDTALKVQSQSPLLWIINTAPFFLGLFAYFIGQQLDRVHSRNKKLVSTQEQLVLQQQMASIGKMMAGIAHEIKNPLNFVTNFAESSVEISTELQEALEKRRNLFPEADYQYFLELIDDLRINSKDIQSNGERANRIVLNLMDQTRGSKKERKAVNINDLLDDSFKLAFHSFRTSHPDFNLDIQRNYATFTKVVKANPNSLSRVLLNLFNNACYALMEKKKKEGMEFVPELQVTSSITPEYVEMSIRDNGVGIPPEIRDQIFEPFCTTKPSGEGNAGLGLSISLDIIVQEHGGTLEVDSEPGAFTTFIIRLPIDREPQQGDLSEFKAVASVTIF